MTISNKIINYLNSITEPKRSEMIFLHKLLLKLDLTSKLWYFDGEDENGKLISNPNIGYGSYTIHYANGKSREFYRVGLSANQFGISIYIMGIKDKNYLTVTFGKSIGKAKVSGYCIKFKNLNDVDQDTLISALKAGFD